MPISKTGRSDRYSRNFRTCASLPKAAWGDYLRGDSESWPAANEQPCIGAAALKSDLPDRQ